MTNLNNERAAAICESVSALIRGDRNKAHGDIVKQHQNAAILATAYLKAKYGFPYNLTSEDMCLLMVQLKISRSISGTYNIDDYQDGAGYFGGAGACRAVEEGL